MAIYMWREYSYTPGANTIAYYPLNSTTTVNDLSGNNYTLTQEGNSVVYSNLGVTLPGSSSGYFSGSCIIPQAGPFTICLWANYSATGNDAHCIQQFNSGTNQTAITIGCNNSKWFSWGKGSYDWEVASITTNTWHCIAYSYLSGTINFYIDGVKYTQSRTINTTTPNYFWIGSGGELTRRGYMNGKISEVIIENRAWSDSDVSKHYDGTKSLYGIN